MNRAWFFRGMRKHDARKLDHATLEALRERAVRCVQRGGSVYLNSFSGLISGISAFAMLSFACRATMPICQLRRCSKLWPVEVGLIRRLPVEARMGPSAIIKTEIGADRSASLGHRIVGSEIHLFPFDRPPKPLDKDIVTPRAFAVHADGDAAFKKHAGELGAGELAALI